MLDCDFDSYLFFLKMLYFSHNFVELLLYIMYFLYSNTILLELLELLKK